MSDPRYEPRVEFRHVDVTSVHIFPVDGTFAGDPGFMLDPDARFDPPLAPLAPPVPVAPRAATAPNRHTGRRVGIGVLAATGAAALSLACCSAPVPGFISDLMHTYQKDKPTVFYADINPGSTFYSAPMAGSECDTNLTEVHQVRIWKQKGGYDEILASEAADGLPGRKSPCRTGANFGHPMYVADADTTNHTGPRRN